jgi:dihydroneopterin aldolase
MPLSQNRIGFTMDIIFLRGLHIETIVGIHDRERVTRQTVALDLEIGYSIGKASASDAIEDTLDYKAVADRVSAFVAQSSFFLVETLAEKIAGIVLHEFGAPWVKVTLNKKQALAGACEVGVVIERGVKPGPE